MEIGNLLLMKLGLLADIVRAIFLKNSLHDLGVLQAKRLIPNSDVCMWGMGELVTFWDVVMVFDAFINVFKALLAISAYRCI